MGESILYIYLLYDLMSFKKLLNRLCFDRTTTNENPPPPKPSDIIEYTIEKKFNKDYECIICLEEFNENETVSITKCGHLYHTHLDIIETYAKDHLDAMSQQIVTVSGMFYRIVASQH